MILSSVYPSETGDRGSSVRCETVKRNRCNLKTDGANWESASQSGQ